MNELTKWNYDNSVKKMRPLVVKWKNCTVEMLEELSEARDELSSRYHRDGANASSWNDYCVDIGLTKSTANRWLKSYNPKTKQIEDKSTAHVSHNSGNNEWYTPEEIINISRAVLNEIDLDPATTGMANDKIKAKEIFTLKENGLEQEWNGRVWLNPPYSQPEISQFCEKLIKEYDSGKVTEAIVLINNATETNHFQDLATYCSAICFPRGRIKFWSPNKDTASPLQGQSLLYLGKNIKLFKENFSKLGLVLINE